MCLKQFQVSFLWVLTFLEVLWKFQRCFKRVSRVFQLRWKGVLNSFKGGSRVFERSFNGVSGSFKEVSRKFQECRKEVSGLFQYSFKED